MDSAWRRIVSLHADEWICRFANELRRLGLNVESGLLIEWAFQMWRTDSARNPEEVARDEVACWPH